MHKADSESARLLLYLRTACPTRSLPDNYLLVLKVYKLESALLSIHHQESLALQRGHPGVREQTMTTFAVSDPDPKAEPSLAPI